MFIIMVSFVPESDITILRIVKCTFTYLCRITIIYIAIYLQDYDYAYDYSEMTIKPQNGTTPKPLNNSSTATETDNSTATGLIIEQTTLPIKSNISQIPVTTEVAWHQAVNDSITTVKTLEPVTVTTETPDTMNNKNETSNGTHCRKGYVANKKGECELKLQGAGNA